MAQNNNCGTDCEYSDERQEEINREQKNISHPIQPHCEDCVQSEIEKEYKNRRLRKKKQKRCRGGDCSKYTTIGQWPCTFRSTYLPRFLAEAKLPGWTEHSEYVLSGCPSTKREVAVEISDTIRGNDYRAAITVVSLLSHFIDYFGPKDRGSYVKLSGRATPLEPGKRTKITLADFIFGRFDKKFKFYIDENGRDWRYVSDVRLFMRINLLMTRNISKVTTSVVNLNRILPRR